MNFRQAEAVGCSSKRCATMTAAKSMNPKNMFPLKRSPISARACAVRSTGLKPHKDSFPKNGLQSVKNAGTGMRRLKPFRLRMIAAYVCHFSLAWTWHMSEVSPIN